MVLHEQMVKSDSRSVCEPYSPFLFLFFPFIFHILFSMVHFLRVFHICAYVD